MFISEALLNLVIIQNQCIMDMYNYDDYENKLAGWNAEMMRKHGWYAHFVPDDNKYPNSINYHTHGLEDSFGHPDLQICFPLPPKIAQRSLFIL